MVGSWANRILVRRANSGSSQQRSKRERQARGEAVDNAPKVQGGGLAAGQGVLMKSPVSLPAGRNMERWREAGTCSKRKKAERQTRQ